jgi:hypothetical protein
MSPLAWFVRQRMTSRIRPEASGSLSERGQAVELACPLADQAITRKSPAVNSFANQPRKTT